MNVVVRAAQDEDADHMASILNEIVSIGGLTSHEGHFDGARIRREFISPQRGISCFVAVVGSAVRGFQSLEWSDPDWPGEDRLPADWALISTYVKPGHHRLGIGRALFERTVAAAAIAGVCFIVANIRLKNAGAQTFYDRLGFEDDKRSAHAVSKYFSPRRR